MTLESLPGEIYSPPWPGSVSERIMHENARAVGYKDLVFTKIYCSRGLWLVPTTIPNKGAHVYFRSHDKDRSQGFGGATLTFKCDDNTTIDLQGPWHGNTESLFIDTKLDIRNTHYTRVIVFDVYNFDKREFKIIHYIERNPVLGEFDRYKEIAKLFPNARRIAMFSEGGSVISWTDTAIKASEKEKEDGSKEVNPTT